METVVTEMLYASSVDVSRPTGPGVNEVQFIMAAAERYGEDAHFVIPHPSAPLPEEFPRERVTVLPPLRRRSPVSWLRHQHEKRRVGLELIARLKPDYVVLRGSMMPIAELAMASSGPPAFLKTAGSGRFPYLRAKPAFRPLVPAQMAMFGRLLKRVRRVDVVSSDHRACLEATYPAVKGRVEVFDNAADTRIFRPLQVEDLRRDLGLDRFDKLIGYVGNAAASNGALDIIAAWPHLKNASRVGLVVVAGDGADRAVLAARARTVGAGDHLVQLGPVPISEVPRYMGLLDIGVSFRKNDGSSEMKVRQYLACGVPVLVSARVNAFVDAAGIGMTVARDDPRAIARAADRILDGACAPSADIRSYAESHLSYAAAIDNRQAFWRAAAAS